MAALLAFKEKLNMIQNNNPKHFALTSDEGDLVIKIDDIISAFNNNFIVVDENGKSQLVLPNDYYQQVKAKIQRTQYNRKRINLKKAEELAKRIFSKPWYTIMIAGESEKTGKLLCRMVSSETKGKSVLIKENSPFYSLPVSSGQFISTITDENYLEERKALGLSPEHKFLYSVEYVALKNILRLKNAPGEFNVVPSGEWIIKSSPMLTLPVNVGRKAITQVVEGKRQDRGKMIIPIGTQSITFTPNKAAANFLKGNINAQKLLDTIQHEAALAGYKTTRLAIPLKKILEERGLKDMKELKKQLTAAAAILDDMSFTGQLGGGDYEKLAVTQGDTDIKNGFLYVNINEKFFSALKQTKQVLLYTPEIMKLPSMGYSYGFARYFAEHKRKNLGKPNENRISVETLLEIAPYPLYDELPDKGQASQKIIEPFLNCFDKIADNGIFSFKFVRQRGEPLSETEWEDLVKNYRLFASLMVEVVWFDEPDYASVMAARNKAKAKETRRKREALKRQTAN